MFEAYDTCGVAMEKWPSVQHSSDHATEISIEADHTWTDPQLRRWKVLALGAVCLELKEVVVHLLGLDQDTRRSDGDNMQQIRVVQYF